MGNRTKPPRASAEAEQALHPTSGSACFVCGHDNTRGMKIRFDRREDGTAEARWTPGMEWSGYPGVVHGGLVSTVLDEAMSKALAATGIRTFTAEIRVRFRRPVTAGGEYAIRGWVVDRVKRLITAEATLMDAAGEEFAHAWGRFLAPLPPKSGSAAAE